jgi:hypothetical protein
MMETATFRGKGEAAGEAGDQNVENSPSGLFGTRVE